MKLKQRVGLEDINRRMEQISKETGLPYGLIDYRFSLYTSVLMFICLLGIGFTLTYISKNRLQLVVGVVLSIISLLIFITSVRGCINYNNVQYHTIKMLYDTGEVTLEFIRDLPIIKSAEVITDEITNDNDEKEIVNTLVLKFNYGLKRRKKKVNG